jgi:mannose-6-phosphate isomerase-like protein (cupin superfamily)
MLNDTPRTQLKKHTDMQRRPLPNCHGGQGNPDWTEVLSPSDLTGRGLRFVHDLLLPPGASVGVHRHDDDEEYYYLLSGEGEMTLGDRTFRVAAGDVTAVFPGGRHGLVNTGDRELRILVVSAEPGRQPT